MALLYPDATALWNARTAGASFTDTLTIGRLALYLHPGEVASLRNAYRRAGGAPDPDPMSGFSFGCYCDDFLRTFLGVQSLTVLDNSAYEGANVVHDMNEPLPAEFGQRFDAAIDAGSLEHVFNFPVAVSNLMNSLKVGGRAFISTPANNLCGHGFYQFSPELMYRVFNAANGFEVERLVFYEAKFPSVELTPVASTYEVADPSKVGRRVGLRSCRPVMMSLTAVKRKHVVPFGQGMPQQSDYESLWKQHGGRADGIQDRARSRPPRRRALLRAVFHRLPSFLRNEISGRYLNREYSLSNRQYFRKVQHPL